MIGRVRVTCAAALLFCLPAAAVPAAPATTDEAQPARVEGQRLAQQQGGYNRMAIPQPSQRRSGELEGWSSTDKTPAADGSGKQKTAATTRKGKAAAAPAPAQERDPEDGGLPLPSARSKDNNAPVTFDGQKVGTGLKF